MEMGKLGARANFESLVDVAELYYASYNLCNPSTIARKRVEQFGLPGEEPSLDDICAMFG